MSVVSSHFEAAVESLSRRIVEAEMRSTAAAARLAALAKAQATTTEAEQRLDEETGALLVLRRRLPNSCSPETHEPQGRPTRARVEPVSQRRFALACWSVRYRTIL